MIADPQCACGPCRQLNAQPVLIDFSRSVVDEETLFSSNQPLERVPQKWIRLYDPNALQLPESRARFNDQAIPPDRIGL